MVFEAMQQMVFKGGDFDVFTIIANGFAFVAGGSAAKAIFIDHGVVTVTRAALNLTAPEVPCPLFAVKRARGAIICELSIKRLLPRFS